jgi:hypothetical protein
MNENNVIELWIVGIEYVMVMVVYDYLVYNVSLGYVALAVVYLFALRVCGFTGGVVKGKSRVCGSSSRVFVCPTGMWLYGRCCKR